MRQNKLCGCRDGCSFFTETWDFSILPEKTQIDIEKALQFNEPLTIQQSSDLVSTKRPSCVGGLINDGEIRARCDYFREYPPQTTGDQLVQHFRAIRDRKISAKWQVLTVLFGFTTLLLGVLAFLEPSEEELKTTISELESELELENKSNVELQNELESIKSDLRRLQNSQEGN